MNQLIPIVLLLIVIFTLPACGKNQAEPLAKGPEEAPETTPEETDGPDDTTQDPSMLLAPSTFEINASSNDPAVWVYFDLDTLSIVTVDSAVTDSTWDVAFQRFRIKSNGGISGSNGVQVAHLDLPIDDFDQAPLEGYRSDEMDGADPRTQPGLAFLREGGWYDYNGTTHLLTPKIRTFVVKVSEAKYFALQMTSYYSEAGSPANLAFKTRAIHAPDAVE
jgi:hypothetical protein